MKKKVRILAGPNGSGKSTLYKVMLDDYNLNFGFFINADLIESELKKTGEFDFTKHKINLTTSGLRGSLKKSGINKHIDLNEFTNQLSIKENKIVSTAKNKINSYVAAAIADFLRMESMKQEIYFSYETVFSGESKIDFVKELFKNEYQIYLYVISTVNAGINIQRVKQRAKNNGHNVTEDKIVSRYSRSLQNVKKIIPYTTKAWIIDNSEEFNTKLISEIQNGKKIAFLNKTYQPAWAKKLLPHK